MGKRGPETVITAIKRASNSLIPKENTRNLGLCCAGFNLRGEWVLIHRICSNNEDNAVNHYQT